MIRRQRGKERESRSTTRLPAWAGKKNVVGKERASGGDVLITREPDRARELKRHNLPYSNGPIYLIDTERFVPTIESVQRDRRRVDRSSIDEMSALVAFLLHNLKQERRKWAH